MEPVPREEKWRNSTAKAVLREWLLSGQIQVSMGPKHVYEMNAEFKRFNYERFRSNLNNMRKALKDGSLAAQKPVKWGKSDAKRLLRDDIINGAVPDAMPARDVYLMHDEYKPYRFENFSTNLTNLRAAISKNLDRMQADCLFYAQDRALLEQLRATNPPRLPPYPVWHKHKAKKLLKKDIDENKHVGKKPYDLFISRPEYQDFPLKVFRKHIYQEVDERASKAYRFDKKKTRGRPPMPQQSLVETDRLNRDSRNRNESRSNII